MSYRDSELYLMLNDLSKQKDWGAKHNFNKNMSFLPENTTIICMFITTMHFY